MLPNLREIRGSAWADSDHEISAIFYNDQVAVLGPDEGGAFSPTAAPHTSVTVTRLPDAPRPWDRSTSLIRFRVADAPAGKGTTGGASGARTAGERGALHVGQVGWLRLESRSRTVLTVPVSALLQSPAGSYVLAWAGGQRFEKRPIEIGETFSRQGFAVVLSGLRASDRVVSKATFFLDADRRLLGRDDVGWSTP